MYNLNRTSQRGFSLVELMVVVAIIGVLASIAVPSVNKYIAKARQSEAKINLSSMYTAEKAFFAEYSVYDSRLEAIGYTPEGNLRYNIGFSAPGVQAGAANNYTGTPNAAVSAKNYCGAAGAMGARGCAMANGATNAAPPDIANTMCTAGGSTVATATCTTQASAFRIGAGARIQNSNGALDDHWSIDETKILRNTQLGIR